MAFQDLHAEVEAMFGEIQADYGDAVRREALFAESAGFGIHNAKRPRRTYRGEKEYNRAFRAKTKAEDIKRRILAGERPNLKGPGRPPTCWLRVAAELGIDLAAPVVKGAA